MALKPSTLPATGIGPLCSPLSPPNNPAPPALHCPSLLPPVSSPSLSPDLLPSLIPLLFPLHPLLHPPLLPPLFSHFPPPLRRLLLAPLPSGGSISAPLPQPTPSSPCDSNPSLEYPGKRQASAAVTSSALPLPPALAPPAPPLDPLLSSIPHLTMPQSSSSS
ncbi:unnamed protein product [Closterium sp. NIES-54]